MSAKQLCTRLFQMIAAVIAALLILSTFVPQGVDPHLLPIGKLAQSVVRVLQLHQFYDSGLHLFLWGLLLLVIVVAVFLRSIQSFPQRLLHLVFVGLIGIVIYDKLHNERFFLSLEEGQQIQFGDHVSSPEPLYQTELQLLRFQIEKHAGSEMPRAFTSTLLQDDRDTLILAVNRPLRIGNYRLYQSAYEQNFYFDLAVDSNRFTMTFGDSLRLGDHRLLLDSFQHATRQFLVNWDGRQFQVPLSHVIQIDDLEIEISPAGRRYVSVIEVVAVRGLFWLLVLGLVFLGILLYSSWRGES